MLANRDERGNPASDLSKHNGALGLSIHMQLKHIGMGIMPHNIQAPLYMGGPFRVDFGIEDAFFFT